MKNQILNTKIKKNSDKIFFKFQFTISIVIILILISVICYYLFSLHKKEKSSNNVIDNYNIYKLYSDASTTTQKDSDSESLNSIFGIIEIPSIKIYYPVFSHLNEKLLRISPCKFFGESPKEKGNLCIAGHNYDNSMFFSKICNLNINDEIFLFDNDGKKYIYVVTDIYEVDSSDLSPIFNYNKSEKILTLVTCNNLNSNRIIVRAKGMWNLYNISNYTQFYLNEIGM